MKTLITGASGFVGTALSKRLAIGDSGDAICAMRNFSLEGIWPLPIVQIANISSDTDWSHALQGIDIVVHAAARVHVKAETTIDSLSEFRKINVEGTANLARQASAKGVKRFIFLSSIKVNGESTQPGYFFTAGDVPAPKDAYSISKYEAEQILMDIGRKSAMEIVIIRPPLVYGPGVKANFRSMMRWLDKGIPLPLGAINNKRSLISLDNLVDLIVTCLAHPAAGGNIFLASDDEDLSTPDLLRRTAHCLGRPVRLISVPPALLELSARMIGKPEIIERLCASLQLNIAETKTILGWTPPIGVDMALKQTAVAFLNH